MWPFWEHVIAPTLDAAGARNIVEVGAEQGRTTKLLLDRAARVGGVVHAVDPAPRSDVSHWEMEHGERFRFHRARSHDVGWPYGRRDMYYDPQQIPKEHRHPSARSGMVPGRSELSPQGINATYWNATNEGGPRNGVLTAIEDFAKSRSGGSELAVVPGWHRLAVLASPERISKAPALGAAIRRLSSAEFLRAQLERIERARIVAGSRARPAAAATPGPPATTGC